MWTGFNPDVVNNAINNVKNSYNALMNALHDEIQNSFVGGMESTWACNQAKKFFAEFKPVTDQIIKFCDQRFLKAHESMKSAGKAWAQLTDTSYDAPTFQTLNAEIKIDGIQENINGNRGIIEESARNIIAKLPTIFNNANDALTSAQNAVRECGFLDQYGLQSEELIAAFGTIKNQISKLAEELTTSTDKAIKETLEVYGELTQKVKEAYTDRG